MAKKIPPTLIRKYDIANKIFEELVDLESRHILFSVIRNPKDAQQISYDLKIPVSSVYKKIKSLLDLSLISEVKRDFTDSGRIIKFYQSRITDAQISISRFEPTIKFKKNTRIQNKLTDMKTSVGGFVLTLFSYNICIL